MPVSATVAFIGLMEMKKLIFPVRMGAKLCLQRFLLFSRLVEGQIVAQSSVYQNLKFYKGSLGQQNFPSRWAALIGRAHNCPSKNNLQVLSFQPFRPHRYRTLHRPEFTVLIFSYSQHSSENLNRRKYKYNIHLTNYFYFDRQLFFSYSLETGHKKS